MFLGLVFICRNSDISTISLRLAAQLIIAGSRPAKTTSAVTGLRGLVDSSISLVGGNCPGPARSSSTRQEEMFSLLLGGLLVLSLLNIIDTDVKTWSGASQLIMELHIRWIN